jgi:iron complex transport system substrate-binding protein
MQNLENIAGIVVDTAFHLHKDLGPGLFESVYEPVLAKLLMDRGLRVVRQISVPIHYQGLSFDEGFRADLIVEECFLIELKSVENLAPVHFKQALTYLRLMNFQMGFLINFGSPTFTEGIKRIVNHHHESSSSPLRIHQA